MKRPLIFVALFYVVGILLGSFISFPLSVLMTGAFGLLIGAFISSQTRRFCIAPLIVLCGWICEAMHADILSPHDLRLVIGSQPALVTLRGLVDEAPAHHFSNQNAKQPWRTSCQLEINAAGLNRHEWQPAVGRVTVSSPGLLTNYFAGQTVEVTGVAHLPKVAAAKGLFDNRYYLKQKGIYYQLDTESEQDWTIISSPSRRPFSDRFRDWAKQALALGLPVEDEALRLEWALTLGWKPALTEEVSEPFIRAATYHIFAVDGLRMAIIFGIFFTLLRAFSAGRAVSGLVLIPLIWSYTALTGWPASAVRATVMLTLVICGWVLKRPVDLLNSLFAAAMIILVWQPQQLFQAGFQLSFLVVLCMVLCLPLLRQLWERAWAPDPLLPKSLLPRWRKALRGPGRYVSDIFLTSLAAWIGSIPLVAYYFHIVTPVSTPANLLAVPLCGLVLMSNLASLLVVNWLPACGILFNYAGWFLMECIRVSSHWFADWPKAYFYVAEPSLLSMSLYYGLLLILLSGVLLGAKMRTKLWIFGSVTFALVVWSFEFWREARVTRLHLLPANGGMAIYFDAPGRKNDLLVDCGTTNAVSFFTKPFLRAQGVNKLGTLALTHGDIHHVGGAELLAGLFSVDHVCVSPVRFRSPAYRRLMVDFERNGKLNNLSRNQKLGSWTVVHPDAADHFPQADDNALVLAATLEGTRVLLVSDLGRLGQNALLEREPGLRADIVVTGLSARSDTLGDAFLDSVQPSLIIVIDSDQPVSERANPKLIARLARRNIPVLYTRLTGAASIDFWNGNWALGTMNGVKMNNKSLVFNGARHVPGRSSPDAARTNSF